ncbi:hypothetical protein [Salisaeta longa]|uniref:hypothetical protein n=1 Tax=Salisaeta longa TaxID=503170 RepID=UPI0012FCD3D4|nr:hypothetical protein [Salisaeta longa]
MAPDSCLDTCTPQEQPGMVRVSLGLYNTRADVDAAADALADIAARPDAYRSKYRALRNGHGDWAHTDFNVPPHELLTLEGAADDWVRDALSS